MNFLSSQQVQIQGQKQLREERTKSHTRLRLIPLLTTITALILLGLVMLIPWVLQFHPLASTGSPEYRAAYDAQALLRQLLLLGAFFSFWIPLGLTIIVCSFERRITTWVVFQLALVTSLLAIAIRAFPYWVNGIAFDISRYLGGSG